MYDSDHLVLSSVAAGAATPLVLWGGAQVVGFASTGTAIAGLHGAAAANAGWALFGGGSLASGGGGMALGHLLLPGVGVVVAIGLGTFTTYSKAAEYNQLSDQLADVNEKNSVTLCRVQSDVGRFLASEARYNSADADLETAVTQARRHLRRFGVLSHLRCYFRFRTAGRYYAPHQEAQAGALHSAVNRFSQAVQS